MRSKNLSSRTVAVLVTVALLLIGFVEWRALNIKDAREHPATVLTTEKCIFCHADAKTLARMKEKQGSSTHPLVVDADIIAARSKPSVTNGWSHPGK